MEKLIIELINVIKESSSDNSIILICTIISCLVALCSLVISSYIVFLQFKDRLIRKRVIGFVYSYFSPTYMVDKLPTTTDIQNKLKNIIFSKQDIFETIINLNKENIIQAVGDLETDLENLRWKPHTIYFKQ